MLGRMSDVLLSFRGRPIRSAEVAFLRELIAQSPGLSRRQLSLKVCHAWNWVQPNGQPRDMVCRGLLLALHRAGHISLPAPRQSPPNNVIAHRRVGPVGEHLKYLVWAGPRPVACVGWSSGPLQLNLRDQFVGAPKEAYRHHLQGIAYNTRYLILPWVRVAHLASHLLARLARRISADWQSLYHHPLYLLESFVDIERFPGTCYRAANWICLGRSEGRGSKSQAHAQTSLKELWVYPLVQHLRDQLTQ